MHYAFDKWMDRENPDCPFARYADDAVIHCHTRWEAEQLLRSVAERLDECGLELHPAKSKIVYCKDSNRRGVYDNMQFVFLGFCFRPRCAPSRSGRAFTSFLPAICNDAKKNIRQSIRRWCLQGLSTFSLVEIAERFNPVVGELQFNAEIQQVVWSCLLRSISFAPLILSAHKVSDVPGTC